MATYWNDATWQARQLTQTDYNTMGGQVMTRSGSYQSFNVGDFLCKNFSGQWVLTGAQLNNASLVPVSSPDDQGYSQYNALNLHLLVTATDQGNGTWMCSDGCVVPDATFAAAYVYMGP